MEQFDLIVIGGGRGASLASACSEAGWKTALIERDRLGGTCPNRGCIPSKLLIGFSDAARHVRNAGRHFVQAPFQGADLPRIFESVNHRISGVDDRALAGIEAAGVTLIRGEARFTGPKQISAAGRELSADKIVIATGSRPAPPPFAHLPVWTSDELFPLRCSPPKSLIIIGGGAIGCEMAAFFATIGVPTTLFVREERLLEKEDREIEHAFRREFIKGVPTRLQHRLLHLTHAEGTFTATFETPSGERTVQAERVLFATGRIPNTSALDLHQTSIQTDSRGFIPVDDHLETCVPGIFAAGDANGRHMLLHAAARQMHYLRHRFLKAETAPIDERHMPHAIFSHPELASVGLTEEELITRGIRYVSVCRDWLASARLEAMRIDYPRVKLLVSPDDHSILGCHLVGPEASTLLHQVTAVMQLKNDVRALAEMIYIHPALNECLLEAAVKAVAAVRASRKTTA